MLQPGDNMQVMLSNNLISEFSIRHCHEQLVTKPRLPSPAFVSISINAKIAVDQRQLPARPGRDMPTLRANQLDENTYTSARAVSYAHSKTPEKVSHIQTSQPEMQQK